MPPETKNTFELIRELTSAFVAHPEALGLSAEVGQDGALHWRLTCHPEDEAKLVGKGGTHVNALTFLIALLDAAEGERYVFDLVTKQRGGAPIQQQKPRALTYDPTRAENLLGKLVAAISEGGVNVKAKLIPGVHDAMTYDLRVKMEDRAEALKLTRPRGIEIYNRIISMMPLDALGILFRAIASKDGVKFRIVIED